MKNTFFLAAVGTSLLFSACAILAPNSSPLVSSSNSASGAVTTDENGQQVAPPAFSQFSDIPIPEQAEMDLDRTFALGGSNLWSGRLVFTAPYTQGGLFDFYMSEMPKFGWQEITVVRSKVSVMTFKQGERVATIQIEAGSMRTEVLFTVSPSAGSRVN